MHSSGQASTEFLVILGALILVIGIAALLANQAISNANVTKEQNQARNTVDILSVTAREVYAQGEGARKRVYVVVPRSYQSNASYVSNRTIRMRAIGGDYISDLDFDVHGSLPQSAGGNWVWVISEGNRVRIGTAMILLNKQAITVVMASNSTRTDDFSIKDIFGSDINVSMVQVWNASQVTMSINPPLSFSMVNDEERKVDLTFISDVNATGFYNGRIDINASSGNTSEIVSLPITVEVTVIKTTSASPPLFIIPSVWNASLLPGDNITKEFDVCTNSQTSLSAVDYTTTGGAAGAWVGELASSGAISPDSCVTKVFSLSVPLLTLSGNYTGTITGTGVGVSNAVDTVALNINVGGNLSDNLGPLVLNISRIPKRPFVGDPITIKAVCDDTTRGNTTILKGEIVFDSGTWKTMLPSDGSYNTPAENVSYTYYGLLFGRHNATLRCTDTFGNIGPNVTYTFGIMKELLFITKDLGQSGSEADWVNWLDTHSSNESFTWNKDVVHRNVVIDASFDMGLYATVALADSGVTGGSNGASLVTKIVNFVGNGGTVILLDEALDNSAKDLGISSGGAGSHTELFTTIQNNVHYITLNRSLGNYTIYTTATKIYHIPNYAGMILSTDYNSGGHLTHTQLGQSNSYVTWGPTKPYRFTVNGNDLSTRVFDFVINASTIVAN